MTQEQSLKAIHPFIEKFIEHFKQDIDIVCVFHINGKIKNIIYDSATKTLSEPFPDKTDDNKVMLLPYFNHHPITIKWEGENL